jgi:hypothetical protein
MAVERPGDPAARRLAAEANQAAYEEALAERRLHLDMFAGQLAISLNGYDPFRPLLEQRLEERRGPIDADESPIDAITAVLSNREKERLPEAQAMTKHMFKALTVGGLQPRPRVRVMREPRAR